MRHYPPRTTGSHTGWSPGRDRTAQRRFRLAVLTRDNFTCRSCGNHDPSGCTLEAHHIQPGYDPSVGMTLCNTKGNGCHREEDPRAR